MANTAIDGNASKAIGEVAKTGKALLENMDQSIFRQIQPMVNNLYESSYGRFFAHIYFGIPLGNILAAFLVFGIVFLLRKYLTAVVTRFLLHLSRKTETKLDDIIIMELKYPIRFLFIIIGLDLFFLFLFLHNHITQLMLSSMLIIDIYWMIYSLTPAIQTFLYDYSRHNEHLSYELSSFILRMLRLLIIILALISILYNLGINVTAFVASLGLGGLAFALAARDTAANLFGSIALMLDQSIRIGEWIRVNGVEGVVEDIGMRTTKIRTFEKSFVVVPNSIVANTNIENFSRRGIRRIKMTIGLTYDTTPEQMQKIIYDLRSMLNAHPVIAHDQTLLVRFDRFGDSSLGIFIYAFTNTSDWAAFLETKEDINLKIMEIVKENNAEFAFPSQSLYVEKLPLGNVKTEDL
jgi:MscS family membrane protein